MNILLVRHGEIPSNINKIYAGRSAEKLTSRGENQASEVADRLTAYNIDTLYSSPINRARQTAEIISKKIGVNVLTEDAFTELMMGPWEGLSEYEISRAYPNEWQIWQSRPAELNLPGRERLDELLVRVRMGLKNIYERQTDNNIAIVTHVAIIRVLLLWNGKKSLNLYKTINVPNADIFNIRINNNPI